MGPSPSGTFSLKGQCLKINKPDKFYFLLHSSLFITVFDGNSFPLVKCNKSGRGGRAPPTPQTQTNHTLPSARCQEINTHSTHFSPHDCLHALESLCSPPSRVTTTETSHTCRETRTIGPSAVATTTPANAVQDVTSTKT